MSQFLSEDYRDQLTQMHVSKANFGKGGSRWAPMVKDLCRRLSTTSVLDYGCGKGELDLYFPYGVNMYDPGILKHARPPVPHDIVVCTDVLEHIEPDCLEAVVLDLERLAKKALLLNVNCRAAKKHLPDGRNAHLIQNLPPWWMWQMNLRNHWQQASPEIGRSTTNEIAEFTVVLYPKEP